MKSGIPSEHQKVWIQIGPDILSGRILVQTNRLSAGDTGRQRFKANHLILLKIVNVCQTTLKTKLYELRHVISNNVAF